MEAIIFSEKNELSNFYPTPMSLANSQNSCRRETATTTLPLPLTIPQKPASSPNRQDPNSENPQKKIQLDWITALVFVKFDIDKGNVIESVYPHNTFSKSEQKAISLLSFPDSNSFAGEGVLKFVFRLNRDENCPNNEFSSLFGYVYFNQQRDPTNPRGFSQKSLVIMSALPFSGFFKNALDILGSNYFNQKGAYESEEYLKINYQTMTNEWPKPEPGVQYELSLYGNSLSLSLPKNIYESKHIHLRENNKDEKQTQEQKSFESAGSPAKEVLSDEDEIKEPICPEEKAQSLSTILSSFNLHEKGCFQEINLYKIFKGHKLSSLWRVWECMLTNQPLMVMADLPSQCSEAVLGLLSIIYPLEYQTDYKPYFTIYDPEYREVQDLYDKKIAKCAVMGVTNPLFLKILQNYPNMLHLEEDYLKQKKSSSKKPTILESTQKLYILPDPCLKKMLIPVESEEADAINNSLLRKSLQNLTQNFLSVFHVYLKLQINDIKKFDEKEFMKFLEHQKFPFKAQFSSQKHIMKLYAKFIKSANFTKFIKNFPNVYIVKKN